MIPTDDIFFHKTPKEVTIIGALSEKPSCHPMLESRMWPKLATDRES